LSAFQYIEKAAKKYFLIFFQKSLESKKGRAIFASAFRVRGKRGALEGIKTE
jgi:hypothetical protein